MNARAPKILTIDDERMIRETIAAYLENRGFVVFEAPDGRRGVETFLAERPDLVLVDLRMECGNEIYISCLKYCYRLAVCRFCNC